MKEDRFDPKTFEEECKWHSIKQLMLAKAIEKERKEKTDE